MARIAVQVNVCAKFLGYGIQCAHTTYEYVISLIRIYNVNVSDCLSFYRQRLISIRQSNCLSRIMQFSLDRNTVGPQKATLDRRSSRNRNRRNSIPDIKELSTEIKEKLRTIRKPSSSSATSQKSQPIYWEENFVQYLARKRTDSLSSEETADLSSVRLSSSTSNWDTFLLQARESQTVPKEQPLTPGPSTSAGGVRVRRPIRCVSAPDLFTSSRKLVMRRYPRSLTDTILVSQLEPRQGRSAELVQQFATGWS